MTGDLMTEMTAEVRRLLDRSNYAHLADRERRSRGNVLSRTSSATARMGVGGTHRQAERPAAIHLLRLKS